MKITKPPIDFACPACHSALGSNPGAFFCHVCSREFPILFGIPDFRLRPDPYLTLHEERSKAEKLFEYNASCFAELLKYYYEITDDVPEELASRYISYHENAVSQSQIAAEELRISPDSRVLDAGCGSGGGLIACSQYSKNLVGVDIALRWLVICKKRLEEVGLPATLVCADVESMPFKKECFDRILASDLLENVYSTEGALKALSETLVPRGRVWFCGANRYTLGPHPSTRIWGIGYLPRNVRRMLLKRVRGVDSLRFSNLISPGQIAHTIEKQGDHLLHLGPKKICLSTLQSHTYTEKFLIRIYIALISTRFLSRIILRIGPVFEGTFKKKRNHEQ